MDKVTQAVAETAGGAAAKSGLLDTLAQAFQDGGFFMYPIAVMLILSSVIIVERLYMILFVYSANAAGLMQKVQRLILDNNIEDAIKLCSKRKHAAIYNVFKSALMNADRPFEEIQEYVDVATTGEIPKFQRRMPYLFTIANVATLLGLLGTIIGLIKTFESIGAVEASQKQQLLSSGISTAMNTTAFGLMVAIPSMFVYGYLFNRINGLVDEIDHYTSRLLMLLRTGREYFENFSVDGHITTHQNPKRADKEDETGRIRRSEIEDNDKKGKGNAA